MAIQDSADTYGSVAISALKRLGAREPIILEFRSSFALAGFAGSGLPSWVRQVQNKRYKGPSVLWVTIEGGNYQATLTCIYGSTLLCFILRTFRFDNEYEIKYEYDFRISSQYISGALFMLVLGSVGM